MLPLIPSAGVLGDGGGGVTINAIPSLLDIVRPGVTATRGCMSPLTQTVCMLGTPMHAWYSTDTVACLGLFLWFAALRASATVFMERLPEVYQMWMGTHKTAEDFKQLYGVETVMFDDELVDALAARAVKPEVGGDCAVL